MKLYKKIISVMLTLCITLSFLPCTVFATEDGILTTVSVNEEIIESDAKSTTKSTLENTSESIEEEIIEQIATDPEATTEKSILTTVSENEEIIESDTKSTTKSTLENTSENIEEEIIEQTATDPKAPVATPYQRFTKQTLKSSETERKMADFVFIIDSTGSMDSYIQSVRSNLTEFVEYLASQNIDLRMSLIDYKDIVADGANSTVIHTFDSSKWTSDVNLVKNKLADIDTNGGGDTPETPTDALNKIITDDWGWRPDSSKFAFLLTDAPFKEKDSNESIPDMNEVLGGSNGLRNQRIQVSVISKNSYKNNYKDLYDLTGGEFIDIASNNYYEVMIKIANWIVVSAADSDGDGLLDEWETNGVDTDGDGIIDLHLEQMGADPNRPDIFVEIDWMHKDAKEKKFLFWTISREPEINLAPSEQALRMVWEQFNNHGINIHIDAGSDSIDYVTGRRWGDLSRGNQIDYSDNFELGNNYQNWNSSAKNNFERSRWKVFRYCTFVNQYNGTRSTGIAEGIPGQFFIVACMNDMNNTAVAGTFMHELGHTLGLKHGGDEHTGYKANYLSIMNYSFQLSGLVGVNGTDAVNYSDYILPALDETNLDETRGVDPEGKTSGRNLGTKWFFNGSECSVDSIANQPIDYNQNGTTDASLNLNINGDGDYDSNRGYVTGTTRFAESINDWSSLTYRGGLIGGKGVSTDSDTLIDKEYTDDYMQQELTIDKALELNILGNQGACAIANILPDTIYANTKNQSIKITVNNLDSSVSKPTLVVNSEIVGGKISKTISVPATSGKISNTVVEIPVVANISKGEYLIECELRCENGDTDTKEVTVNVVNAKTVKVTTGQKVNLLQGTSLNGVTFRWEVSNPDIAEVTDGIVYGKKVGKTTVYGYTNDGAMAVCEINVTSSAKKQVLKLTNKTKKNLSVGSSLTLIVIGAKTKVVYKSSNKKIATINNKGKIKAKKVGKVKITVTAIASQTYRKATKTLTIRVIPKTAVIKSLQSKKKGQMTIKSTSTTKGNTGYQIQYKVGKGKVKNIYKKSSKALYYTIKNLKSKQTFKTRIRAYKKIGKKTYYGNYSKWKTFKKIGFIK